MVGQLSRWIWIVIGASMVILPLLPVGASLDDRGPIWMPYLQSWSLGAVMVGVLAAFGGRVGVRWKLERLGAWRLRPTVVVPAIVILLFAASLCAMLVVFRGNPHIVDEMAQLFHARIVASGAFAAPMPDPAEFFLMTNTFVTTEGWVSQYPPGHPAVLSIGLLLGTEWLINPLLGGISAALVYWVGRGLYGPKTGVIAALLFAMSTWVIFMSGTYQSHVSATAFALGSWALVIGPRRPNTKHYLLGGLALAVSAAIRPLDALGAALPLLAFLILTRKTRKLSWMVVGGAPIVVALLALNWKLFGGPLTFGYSALFGDAHSLGFHTDPFGEDYTPAAGLRNLAFAIRRIHIYMWEWPIPALLPVILWALLAPKRRRSDLVVAAGLIGVPALYFFYWHSGFYIGPRFYYGTAPWIALATARAWRWGTGAARRLSRPRYNASAALRVAAAVTLIWGWFGVLPTRIDVYRDGLRTMKLHPEKALADLGVEQAIVLVPESWGTRVIVGLWSLDVSRTLIEQAYRRLDTCDMYMLLLEGRRSGAAPQALETELRAMMSATPEPAPRVTDAPDNSIRLRRRAALPRECLEALRRDYQGFTIYDNLAWRNDVNLGSGLIFVRDLSERNADLLSRYAGWEVWRWAPPIGRRDAPPELSRLGVASTMGAIAAP